MEHVPPSGVCDTKLQQTQHLGETQGTEMRKGHHKEVRVPRRTCFVSNPHVLLKPPLQLWCEPSTPAALEPDTKSHVLPLGKKSALQCRGETAEPLTQPLPGGFRTGGWGSSGGLEAGRAGRAQGARDVLLLLIPSAPSQESPGESYEDGTWFTLSPGGWFRDRLVRIPGLPGS